MGGSGLGAMMQRGMGCAGRGEAEMLCRHLREVEWMECFNIL